MKIKLDRWRLEGIKQESSVIFVQGRVKRDFHACGRERLGVTRLSDFNLPESAVLTGLVSLSRGA